VSSVLSNFGQSFVLGRVLDYCVKNVIIWIYVHDLAESKQDELKNRDKRYQIYKIKKSKILFFKQIF